MRGVDYLPPPVECNLDPIAECNNQCYFCIGQRYLRTNRQEVGEMRQLPTAYLERLVTFLSEWGVRGLCISGGGEPSLHPDIAQIIRQTRNERMDVAFVTNAVRLPNDLLDALMLCRWVALSVNAGNPTSYRAVAGRDNFGKVLENISRLTTLRSRGGYKVDLCYKFLLLPENVGTMVQACRTAKALGVQDFHVRPVDFERDDIEGHRRLTLDPQYVAEQFALCHEMETEDFHVYTVTHKFDPDFHVKHDFKRCLATPLVLPILTDGNAYLCVDRKMEETWRLGSAYPEPDRILDWWGSDDHRRMIGRVDISKCSRCTWSEYQKQAEAIDDDRMCLAFP